MNRSPVSCALLMLVALASCGSEDEGGAGSTAATSTMAPLVSATVPDSTPGSTVTTASPSGVVEFCRLALASAGELPESFIGSDAHVEMVDALATAAPSEIRPQMFMYRDFLASDAIDPADPETKTVDNWPADVRAATADAQAFITDNC